MRRTCSWTPDGRTSKTQLLANAPAQYPGVPTHRNFHLFLITTRIIPTYTLTLKGVLSVRCPTTFPGVECIAFIALPLPPTLATDYGSCRGGTAGPDHPRAEARCLKKYGREGGARGRAGGCEDGAGAGSLPKPQDPEPVSVALNLSSFSSARRTDPLARAATTAVPGRLSTRAELLQQIEADRGRPVLPRRLQLILAAFTRPAAEGDDEARNIDLPALLLYGFDDFLTDTASHRFSAGRPW